LALFLKFLVLALLPGEIDSDEEMEDGKPSVIYSCQFFDYDYQGGEDDIPMPPGLPPGFEEVTSDDDIPMPEGPSPGQELQGAESLTYLAIYISLMFACSLEPQPLLSPHPPGFPSSPMPLASLPPLPPGYPPNLVADIPPPDFLGGAVSLPPPPPPPPPGFLPGTYSFMPHLPGAPWPSSLPPPPLGWNRNFPPPPPPPGFPSYPSTSFPPFPPNAFPPPPPKFLPRQQSSSAMQDPLSSIPHQTFQAHRASQLAPPHPSLPANPTKTSSSAPSANPSLPAKPTAAAEMAAATIFAAPELRDLKKEATSFVPSAVKRKKVTATEAISKLNAAPALSSGAPSVGDDVEATEVELARPDLVSALKVQFGPVPVPQATKSKSDYDKFVEEMGDILGTK